MEWTPKNQNNYLLNNKDDYEEDDMANELNYIKESYYKNNRINPFGRRLSDFGQQLKIK